MDLVGHLGAFVVVNVSGSALVDTKTTNAILREAISHHSWFAVKTYGPVLIIEPVKCWIPKVKREAASESRRALILCTYVLLRIVRFESFC